MATRSTIAIEYADGTIGKIYCHWDGYLDHNGRILADHYSDPFKLQQLIDLGDVSSLRPEIGEQHAFSRLDTSMPEDEYERLYGNMTTFYGRDRGESGCEARNYDSFDDYLVNSQMEEYNYVLRRDGRWYVEYYATEGGYITLEDALTLKVVDEVMEQIRKDIQAGDFTAIQELLRSVPRNKLEGFLPEVTE